MANVPTATSAAPNALMPCMYHPIAARGYYAFAELRRVLPGARPFLDAHSIAKYLKCAPIWEHHWVDLSGTRPR